MTFIKRLISDIEKYLTVPKLHWYNVRVVVKNKRQHRLCDFTTQLGLLNQSSTLDLEMLRKLAWDDNSKKSVTDLIGTEIDIESVAIELICYLGHFRKQNKT